MPPNFQSELMEVDLVLLHGQFQILLEFQLEVLGLNDRACSPPLSRMSLYEKCLRVGLRLPLHPFFVTLFQFLDMSPSLIISNSWRHICDFITVCILVGIQPSIILFLSFLLSKTLQVFWMVVFVTLVEKRHPSIDPKCSFFLCIFRRSAFYLCPKCLAKVGALLTEVNLESPSSKSYIQITRRGMSFRSYVTSEFMC